MKKLIFGLDDFAEMLWDGKPLTIERIARIAQSKHDAFMKELMDGAKVVYGMTDNSVWTTYKRTGDTHTALLIDVKEIEKKCEKHEPMSVFDRFDQKVEGAYRNKCTICGVEIEPTGWAAK